MAVAAAAHVTVCFFLRAVDGSLLCVAEQQGDREATGWSLSGHTDSQARTGALRRHTASPTALSTVDTRKPNPTQLISASLLILLLY